MISEKLDHKIFQILGLSEIESKILCMLIHEPLTPSQISKTLKSNKRKIYRILIRLEKRGLVSRQSGFYSCPPNRIKAEINKMRKELNQRKQNLKVIESELAALLNSRNSPPR